MIYIYDKCLLSFCWKVPWNAFHWTSHKHNKRNWGPLTYRRHLQCLYFQHMILISERNWEHYADLLWLVTILTCGMSSGVCLGVLWREVSQACRRTDSISCISKLKGWTGGGKVGSLLGSGGEVGVLHGVETVNGVSHSPWQEAAVPRC